MRAVHAASSYARVLHLPGHCVIAHWIYCVPFRTVCEERDCSFLCRLFQALSIMEYKLFYKCLLTSIEGNVSSHFVDKKPVKRLI